MEISYRSPSGSVLCGNETAAENDFGLRNTVGLQRLSRHLVSSQCP